MLKFKAVFLGPLIFVGPR